MTKSETEMAAENTGPADVFVFFGATGDLARKQIFPALYAMAKRGTLTVPVVGVAHSGWELPQLRNRAKEAIQQAGRIDDRKALDRLLSLLRYVDGDYNSDATFQLLKKAIGDARHPAHYLAIPPVLFGTVVKKLGAAGLAEGARVIIEKPFGHDLQSARALNGLATSVFGEDSIFRIDHFLGKEAVENLLYFRFANSVFEPLWNRDHIASVQVTMAEAFGVEGRGAFYDATGCLRDVVENHLFQIVALLAIEPPVGMGTGALRGEKAKVFRAMRPLESDDLVRGQFSGYRSEPGVAATSGVETYCAMRLQIDSWRWNGVPWLLRAGKRMPVTATEVVVQFRPPPQRLFADSASSVGKSNYLRFRLAADPAIALAARVKRPGEASLGDQRELYLQDAEDGAEPPYERLLGDAMAGNGALFSSEDMVEAAWAVVDPVLKHHSRVQPYEPGSWGPKGAERLAASVGGWREPLMARVDARQSSRGSARKPQHGLVQRATQP